MIKYICVREEHTTGATKMTKHMRTGDDNYICSKCMQAFVIDAFLGRAAVAAKNAKGITKRHYVYVIHRVSL